MRRGIATVVMVSAVAIGAAACGSTGGAEASAGSAAQSPTAPPTSAAASASVDAATTKACQDAVKASDTAAANIKLALDELKTLVPKKNKDADDKARVAELEKYEEGALKHWSYDLFDFSAQATDAGVKAALSGASLRISKLTDGASVDTALTTTAGARDKVKAACAD
ncbi:hypothetical protein AB0J82_39295 [Asanoa sp. NPDC049518]|uniref:hypothetical protein n=1 Tax=unclassified Asanoa TaxID=2685164 RepID=UPI00341D1653